MRAKSFSFWVISVAERGELRRHLALDRLELGRAHRAELQTP